MNLLINAADALQDKVDPKPRIEVQTSRVSDVVIIRFIDNGTGIEPRYMDLVFNEHFTTKGKGRGSGLGLAVCRSLIRDAGGDITIVSESGVGTTVSVTLPVPKFGDDAA